ncbi:MAG: alpha/beta hydrolase [Cytophagaceae bacterium]|nr:alpha/beta hydrolase [Cytophagaceae bacterium]
MVKVLFFWIISLNILIAQTKIIPLYEGAAPGLKPGLNVKEDLKVGETDGITRLRDITVPTLTVFSPKNKTSDAAVIICPGGGYYILAWDHEGTSIGEWFAKRGVTAFVLKYRLPQPELFENSEIRPLQDIQQAIRFVRKNASEYKLNPAKIGVMGFSAGGHLAATASTHFNKQVGEIVDPNVNVRPDFSILMYPVISFTDGLAHLGSRDNLLNKNISLEKIKEYSNELQVNKDTPPAFLVHAIDDGVLVGNSIEYVKALKSQNIPVEMHIYDNGGHGFSMKKSNTGPVAKWPDRLAEWMQAHNWMK